MQSLVAHIKIKGVGVYDKELYETPKDAYWSPFCLDGPGYGMEDGQTVKASDKKMIL